MLSYVPYQACLCWRLWVYMKLQNFPLSHLILWQHLYTNFTLNMRLMCLWNSSWVYVFLEQIFRLILRIHLSVSVCLLALFFEPHDYVIKWKHFPRYWPFVRGIHRSPVNSLHKGQWRGALMFSLICVSINGWENNRDAGDLGSYRAHYDVIVMIWRHLSGSTLDREWLGTQKAPSHFRNQCWCIVNQTVKLETNYKHFL